MNLTELFAEYIINFQYDSIPDDVLEKIRMCLLDWIAVTNKGAMEQCSTILWDYISSFETGGNSSARRRRTAAPEQAALFNGTAAHSFDFDDIVISQPGHPGGPVIAAALAAAEAENSNGKDFLEAVCLGVHLEQAVSSVCVDALVAGGWHSTSIVGVLGAAAAAAKIMKLDKTQCISALALASTMASGIRAEFGTMGKPLHVGKAAANGIFAASIAKKGYTGAADSLEKKSSGYLYAFAHHIPADDIYRVLADPQMRTIDDIGFKYYPCCFLNATAIENALEIREQMEAGDKIAGIDYITYPDVMQRVDNPDPHTGLEAKFSVQFNIAAAMVLGDIRADTFTDEMTAMPDIRELVPKISLQCKDTQEYTLHRCGDMKAVTESGKELHSSIDLSQLLRNPASMKDHLFRKYDILMEDCFLKDIIRDTVLGIDRLDSIRRLGEMLR